MVVGTEDSVGSCDSKTAHNNALFSCPVRYGVGASCSELAVVVSVRGLETASLGVCRLA